MYKVCLYEENYKTLINQRAINVQSVYIHGQEGLNTVKMLVLPNFIYRFQHYSNKNPASYFVDTDKLTLKFAWKAKEPEEPTQYGKRRTKLGV